MRPEDPLKDHVPCKDYGNIAFTKAMRNAGEQDSSINKKLSGSSPYRPGQMIVEAVPKFVERNGNVKQPSLPPAMESQG